MVYLHFKVNKNNEKYLLDFSENDVLKYTYKVKTLE